MSEDFDAVVDDAQSRAVLGLAWGGVARFAEMLADQGELRGLIGPRELPRLWTRHVVNSAAVAQFLPAEGSVADVGSGAGLPGVVLALMRPELDVHLIEPMERRITWLSEVVEELDLDNVQLHHGRAEELHGRLKVSVATARAVAALDKLARMTLPLVEPGGRLLAQKGRRAAEEVSRADSVLRQLGGANVRIHEVDLLGDGDVTRVVEVLKTR
ncbi:16S rRNA (guanine(527)-N(7))-methyltransferase RsmG [Ruania halotolerans]|uniref:16S rRNA (guanine(527)-N(7))-methyltransferase RsmG n=1 Tax=Ruania halotolerans TaxID=2897773 RepID=UPI001E5A5BDB|nr:16S rRNA (guanine(527)-N(7))-methyltransferase RsmG [Ruania halotolerans]UFU06531.1 16S rRNA (guanine(527)-N(7))-methyltransferase RsmG [Ruania halotolerans]